MDGSSTEPSGGFSGIDLVQQFKDVVGVDVEAASKLVYREARKLTRGDPSAAKELAQDVWEHVCDLLRNGRLTRRVELPEPWLRALVRNQLLQNLRKAAALKRRGDLHAESLEQNVEAGREPASGEDGPEDIAVRADLHQRLHAAVADLPTHLHSVVTLILNGHTHSEIAAILGIPVNTSKTRLRAALELLRGAPGLAAN